MQYYIIITDSLPDLTHPNQCGIIIIENGRNPKKF